MIFKKNKPPKTIYVRRYTEGDDVYYMATTGVEDFEHGDIVGQYELIDTHKIKVSHDLVEP